MVNDKEHDSLLVSDLITVNGIEFTVTPLPMTIPVVLCTMFAVVVDKLVCVGRDLDID